MMTLTVCFAGETPVKVVIKDVSKISTEGDWLKLELLDTSEYMINLNHVLYYYVE